MIMLHDTYIDLIKEEYSIRSSINSLSENLKNNNISKEEYKLNIQSLDDIYNSVCISLNNERVKIYKSLEIDYADRNEILSSYKKLKTDEEKLIFIIKYYGAIDRYAHVNGFMFEEKYSDLYELIISEEHKLTKKICGES